MKIAISREETTPAKDGFSMLGLYIQIELEFGNVVSVKGGKPGHPEKTHRVRQEPTSNYSTNI